MPQLDVSFVVSDPMLADAFNVIRNQDVVDQHGRTTRTPVQTFKNVVGVVTQQNPAALMNKDDMTVIPRRIFIATKFAMRAGAKDGTTQYQADQVVWNGTTYKVTEVLPYSRYGSGTYEVIAESQTATDSPQ